MPLHIQHSSDPLTAGRHSLHEARVVLHDPGDWRTGVPRSTLVRGNRSASVGMSRHNGACVQLVIGVHQRRGSSPLQQQAPAIVNIPPAACAAHLSWQELRGRRRACMAQAAQVCQDRVPAGKASRSGTSTKANEARGTVQTNACMLQSCQMLCCSWSTARC